MSAEVEILGKCICGNKLHVEIDFVDDDIVLAIQPCSQCLKNILQGQIWSFPHERFAATTKERLEMLGIKLE